MDYDVLARRSALAAIPLLALAIYLLRSDPEATAEDLAEGASSASAASVSNGLARASTSASARSALSTLPKPAAPPAAADPMARGAEPKSKDPSDRFQALGERALATPPPLATAAADLPPADDPQANPGVSPQPDLTGGPCGGVWVRLITTSKDPKWSFASIAPGPGQETKMRRAGDSVAGWKVQKIEWDRVWLLRGGTKCAVGIHAGAREARKKALQAGAGKMLQEADSDPAPWHVPHRVAAGIHKRSETEFQISEDVVDAIFEHGATLLSGLSLEPIERGGQVVGVAIGRVRPDSLPERLGLQSGDVLLAINEVVCSTLEETIAGLLKAREHGVLIARLERDGQTFDLEIRVRQEAPG